MEIKAEPNPRVSLTLDGRVEITFTTNKAALNGLEKYKDKELLVKISSFTQKRSLSQNAYMWVLLDELAKKIHSTKEEVYRNYIKDYGSFEIIPIKNEAVNRFKKSWSNNGLGWICEDIGDSKLDGYTKLIAYYGTSSYNSEEMARVIDAIVQDCDELGISTMTLSDIMLLKNDNDVAS